MKNMEILEYDKILKILSDMAVNAQAKDIIQNLNPSDSIDYVRILLSETDQAFVLYKRFGEPDFGLLSNPTSSIQRANLGGMLSICDLLNVMSILTIARKLKRYKFEETTSVAPENAELGATAQGPLFKYFDALSSHKDVEDEISSAIISEDEISDRASLELATIRRAKSNESSKIKNDLHRLINSDKYRNFIQETIVTLRNDRHVVPVKIEHKNKIKGIVHDISASGSTVFIEPASVVDANNRLRELGINEIKEIERILYMLSRRVAEISDQIMVNFRLIIDLDVIFAKAKLADFLDGCCPTVNSCGIISIKEARHPLLDKKKAVPIDIELGKTFDALVITGPNTGGKTVALKTIGLLCLMTQTGLFIPANRYPDIPIFRKIYADIGDEQSIEQNLSTFSSHMKNIINILNEIDSNSLVLLDELGVGTDPSEGAALASAILERITQLKAKVVITTHYSELKIYAMTTPGVENASCEFDIDKVPTYKLVIGLPGRSNAFDISQKLGLDDLVILKAQNFLSDKVKKFEDVLSLLEQDRKLLQEKITNLEQSENEIEKLKIEIQTQYNDTKTNSELIVEQANTERRKILEDTKKYVDSIIKEVSEKMKNAEISEQHRMLQDFKRQLSLELKPIKKHITRQFTGDVNVGDAVLLNDIKETGTIISINKKNNTVKVTIGSMKINTEMSNISILKRDVLVKRSVNFPIKNRSSLDSFSSKSELDLRAQTLDNALLATDKFLDESVMAGLTQVTIIHGKGSGVLRTGIQNLLKQHCHVKSFRSGQYGEGGLGVTVVSL